MKSLRLSLNVLNLVLISVIATNAVAKNSCSEIYSSEDYEYSYSERDFTNELWKLILENEEGYSDLEMLNALNAMLGAAEKSSADFFRSDATIDLKASGKKAIDHSLDLNKQIMKSVSALQRAVTLNPTMSQKLLKKFRSGDTRIEKLARAIRSGQVDAQEAKGDLEEERAFCLSAKTKIDLHKTELIEARLNVLASENEFQASLKNGGVTGTAAVRVREAVIPALEKSAENLIVLQQLAMATESALDLRLASINQVAGDYNRLVNLNIPALVRNADRKLDLNPRRESNATSTPNLKELLRLRLQQTLKLASRGSQIFGQTPKFVQAAAVTGALIFNPVSLQTIHTEYQAYSQHVATVEKLRAEQKARERAFIAERDAKLKQQVQEQASQPAVFSDSLSPDLNPLSTEAATQVQSLTQLNTQNVGSSVRVQTVINISNYHGLEATDAILGFLSDPYQSVRDEAFSALGKRVLPQSAVDKLGAVYNSANYTSVRVDVLKLMSRIDSPKVLTYLVAGGAGDYESIRNYALGELGRRQFGPEHIGLMIDLHNSSYSVARIAAVQMLATIHSPQVLPTIVSWMKNENYSSVINAETSALAELTKNTSK